MTLWFALAACIDRSHVDPADPPLPAPYSDKGCALLGDPVVSPPDDPAVSLASRLSASFETPAAVTLYLDGVPVASFPSATRHDLPVLGLRAGIHEARLTWTCDPGGGASEPIAVDVGAAPDGPVPILVADDATRRAPGLTLVTVRRGAVDQALVLDAEGEPVWAYDAPGLLVDVRLEPDGTVWMVVNGEVRRMDRLGQLISHFSSAWDPYALGGMALDVGPFHHEVFPAGDGFVTISKSSVEEPAYPLDPDDPYGATSAETLEDAVILEVDGQGGILAQWPLSQILDTTRIGFLGRNDGASGLDWVHANGVAIDPVDGDLVVSVRHQDVVIELDRVTGALEWMLGPPDGWASPWADKRLQPVGDLDWNYHQHAPMPTDDGGLVLFDNGNFGRTSAYGGEEQGEYSRVVEFVVDEDNGTVSQRFELVEASGGPLFCFAFGDADRLPNGNFLGVYGAVDGGAHLVEAAPDGTVVWELVLGGGYTAQRAQRLVSMYAP